MLLKITLVALVTLCVKAQPFYTTYHHKYVNLIACVIDADCIVQDPQQGHGFNCYNATYMQGRSNVLTGGHIVEKSGLCLP